MKTDPLEDAAVDTTDDDDSTSTTSEIPKRRTSVSFDKVKIREYVRCLGNNPATTKGPPLSIGWEYREAGEFDVEEYEDATQNTRRSKEEILVPSKTREEMLSVGEINGPTREEMKEVMDEIRLERSRRQMTVAMQEYEAYAIVWEFLRRRWRRLRSGVSKKEEEKLLWKNARSEQLAKQ